MEIGIYYFDLMIIVFTGFIRIKAQGASPVTILGKRDRHDYCLINNDCSLSGDREAVRSV